MNRDWILITLVLGFAAGVLVGSMLGGLYYAISFQSAITDAIAAGRHLK